MIPDERFSATPFRGQLLNPWSRDRKISFHWGPAQVQDPSQGLLVKVWTLRADGGEAVLSAPGSPTVTVFTRSADIDNVSLSFDQNGRPCVCFEEEGGASYLYWFDPVPNEPTFMEVIGESPRITLDDARAFNGANSDVILGYIRGGLVRYRQQRERFTIEHTPPIGEGGVPAVASGLRHISMNSYLRLEFITDGAGDEPWTLADVVEDLCVRAGIPPERIDVRELYGDIVHGIRIDSDDGLTKPMEQLRDVFFFDKAEYDGKLHFPKRGREVVARIPYSDLVRGNPTALRQELEDETDLAKEVNVNHLDPDGGFAKNKQSAQRRSNLINAQEKKNVETQVVLTVDQAATAAETLLRIDWNELVEYKFATTIKWTQLTAGDNVEVEDHRGVWHRMRLEERNEDGHVIEWEARQDAGARTYGATRTGNAVPPPTSTTPGIVSSTQLEVIDISPLRDRDDELGLYIAAAGQPGATWAGYHLFVSLDGGVSYGEAFRSELASTIGESVTGLPAEPGHDIVSSETVEVTTNFPLVSVDPSQIATGSHRCVIGSEVFQFETATLIGMVGPLYHYELSGLHRAKYGTEALLWPMGTRFVVLDETVAFVQAERNMIGLDLYYKPVSTGHSSDETTATVYLFDEPSSQIEWTPDDVQAVRDGVSNDVEVTWSGRPRLGQFGTPYHSKYFRGYRVRFSDDHVIETQSETVTYPNAPIGVTVTVCGLNEITGEGPASASVAT